MWVKLSPRWQVRQTAAHREMLPFHLLFTRSIITLHFKHTQSAAATLLPTRAPPGGSLLRGGWVQMCVLMRKYFLETYFIVHVCVCVFPSLDLHFCAFFCTCMRKYECFRSEWIFALHVCWSHSCFMKLFKQLACNMAPLCMFCMFVCVYGVVSLCASALCWALVLSLHSSVPFSPSHSRCLSLGDKAASHFMWPYRSRLQPRSLQGSCHSSF